MKIQDILDTLGNSGCLILCYAEMCDVKVIDIINNFEKLVLKDIITEDCYVKDADKLLRFFNIKNKRVIKVNKDDVYPNEKYIASYEKDGNNHFVICKNDKVIYNTLENSYCVKYGKQNQIVRVIR